jgi:hypothetical protein
MNNNQSKYMYKVDDFLKNRMSYDYLFKLIVEYDRLKTTLFTVEQHTLFENMPKISLDDLQDRSNILNKANLKKLLKEVRVKGAENINDNLLKYFKY